MRNKHTKCLAASLAINLLIVSITLGQNGEQKSKINLEKVRAHIKKAAQICRTTPPPGKPIVKEQGGYLDAIQPVLSQGKKALPKLQKLLSSENLDVFEKHLIRIIIERIKNPSRFQKITPHLPPYKGNPLEVEDLKKSARDRDRRHLRVPSPYEWLFWNIKSPAYDVELLHKDYSDLIKKHEKVYQEILSAGKLLWKDAKANKQRDWKALKSVMKSYDVRLERIDARGVHFLTLGTLVDISPYAQRSDQLRFNPVYRLAWEEAMVRPFPWPKKHEFFGIVSKIDKPESAPAVAEFLRQAFIHSPRRRSEPIDFGLLSYTCEALGRWPSHDNAIVISELLASVKGKNKREIEIHMGAYFSKSKKWKDIIAKIKMDSKMNEHFMRLDSSLKTYAEYEKLLKKSSKQKTDVTSQRPAPK